MNDYYWGIAQQAEERAKEQRERALGDGNFDTTDGAKLSAALIYVGDRISELCETLVAVGADIYEQMGDRR